MELGHYYNSDSKLTVQNSTRHLPTLVLGKKKTGKTTLLKKWAIQDIYDGKGLIYFDLDGKDIDDLLTYIPQGRKEDVVLFDLSDTDNPMSFNVFDGVPERDRSAIARLVVSAFKSITGYTINTPTLNRVLYNSSRVMLDTGGILLIAGIWLVTS